MGSSYGSYGYGDYSGYNNYYGYNQQQGGSVLGSNTSMSMNNSQLGATPQLTDQSPTSRIMDGVTKTYNDGLQEKKSGGGGIKDFFKGIFNGLKNLVKSLADPKTWLMIAACIALCMFVPGAGVALMALGIGMASMQIFKGVSSGNMEQAGEGTFNLALCFLGGTSGMKAGKGAESANFSRAGTRVTQAEAKLVAAQKANDAKAIESAQKAVDVARMQMARTDASAMSAAAREAHLKNPNVASLKTADDFTAAKATSQNSLMAARSSVDDAQAALTAAEKTKDTAAITKAQSNLAVAETNAKNASANLHNVYLAERIHNTKDVGMMGRTGEYLKGTGTRTKDSMAMLFGRPMTSADGRTVGFWSRTPKPPGEAAAAANASTKAPSKWNPANWGKGKPDPAAASKNGNGSASTSSSSTSTASAGTSQVSNSAHMTPKQMEASATITRQLASRQQGKFQAEQSAAQGRMATAEAQHGKNSAQYKAAEAEAAAAGAQAQKYGQVAQTAQKQQLAARTQQIADDAALAAEKAKAAADAAPKDAKLAATAKETAQRAEWLQGASKTAGYTPKNAYVPPPPTNQALQPGMWERVKGNIAPGFIGSQSLTPLFGMLGGGGQGGGLLG